jgi:hypothetical protein
MKYIPVLIFALTLTNCYSQSRVINYRPHYKDSLQRLIGVAKKEGQLNSKLDNLLEFCVPENEQEASEFYRLDGQKDSSAQFRIISSRIYSSIMNRNGNMLRKYLVLSQFVDGYFAETYFMNIDQISSKRKKLFCVTLESLPVDQVTRLSEYTVKCK